MKAHPRLGDGDPDGQGVRVQLESVASMKDRPPGDGDPGGQREPASCSGLDEGPSPPGTATQVQRVTEQSGRGASMKGRPARDGDRVRILAVATWKDPGTGEPSRYQDRGMSFIGRGEEWMTAWTSGNPPRTLSGDSGVTREFANQRTSDVRCYPHRRSKLDRKWTPVGILVTVPEMAR